MVRASGLVVVLLGLPALGSAATFRAHLRRPRHGLQVRLSPITVAPGSEREVCQLVTLPNRKAMDASEITMAMPSGATYTSHHFAIFLYQGEHPSGIPRRPFDRVGFAGVGAQVASPTLALVQPPRTATSTRSRWMSIWSARVSSGHRSWRRVRTPSRP